MNPEENEYMNQIRQELDAERAKTAGIAQSQVSLFNSEEQENLIRWQLDLREDLDRIYHLLKGETLDHDEDGNLFYKPPENDNLRPFNEFGVQLIMNIMSFYLNRNTILSNYDETTINWKVLDFGNDLADLIHNRYQEMGMDNFEKIKMYPMIVRELVDTVHSAYLRAYHGGERESLRTARTVTQSESPFRGQSWMPQQQGQKSKKWYNPTSW